MAKQNALLLDITGIQKFIFSSNKLKENLGASYLVSNLFDEFLMKLSIKPKMLANTTEPDGYIGGGNALLFFNSTEEAEKYLEELTLEILIYAPGISLIAAVGEIDNANFLQTKDALFKKLNHNKSTYLTQTVIPRHGITAGCQSSGYSMDVWNSTYEKYVSAATNAKLTAYPNAKKDTYNKYQEILKDYRFPDEIEHLGQSKGSENHIAIVHIDGNSMGERFKNIGSLEDTRQLSKDVENAISKSFKSLLRVIISDLNEKILDNDLTIRPEEDKKTVPIRPIIMGGDDITFVCDGRMGMYYAKIFMEEFEKQNGENGETLKLSSCAGVAITKTKYPFYKGYQLAEALCANAKSRRREKSDNGSWLDFHIAYGGFSGTLNEIREIHYETTRGSLIYRPYKISDSGEFGFERFLTNVKELNKERGGKKVFPNNKLKELKEVLTLGKEAALTFITEMDARELYFPVFDGKKYHKELYDDTNNITPYFDMLELLEYYPKYELNGSDK
ncbi:MAG: hypothetical protein Q8N83_11970 [Ignavibacteria bacterium]|nr:hypothetical protein [Ignavibacteria bacterium]